jgi:hypothetical protein
MKKIIMGLGIGLFLLSGTSEILALTLENTELVNVTGTVEVKKTNMPAYKPVPKNLKLAGGMKRLDSGDKVKTLSQSGAEMILKETCLLTVRENSRFEIPQVVGQGLINQLKTGNGSYLFKVISGSDFKVKTADVIAGVKGTLFEVEAVDDLRTILSSPNFDLGIEVGGGTNINVYEGEVELNHTQTGKTRRLKPGEGITAFGQKLARLDQALSDGFGPLRRFKPLQKLQENFDKIGTALNSLPSTVKGLSGFVPGAHAMPLSNGLGTNRFVRLFDGIDSALKQRLGQFAPLAQRFQGAKEGAKELGSILRNLRGDTFVPDISTGDYPVPTEPVELGESQLEEIHLGNGLFIAAVPEEGCSRVVLIPENEGMRISEGEGSFRIRDLTGETDGILTLKDTPNGPVSRIQMNKGSLTVRLHDNDKYVSVRSGQTLAWQMVPDGRQQPTTLAAAALPGYSRVAEHRFAAESQIDEQRAAFQEQQNAKRLEAAKQIHGKISDGGQLPDGLKEVGSALGGLIGRKRSNSSRNVTPSTPATPQPTTPAAPKPDKKKNRPKINVRGLLGL